jgi:hypothetical protein
MVTKRRVLSQRLGDEQYLQCDSEILKVLSRCVRDCARYHEDVLRGGGITSLYLASELMGVSERIYTKAALRRETRPSTQCVLG